MINKRLWTLRRYCLNFQEIENYQEAIGSPERYDIHHRKEVEILEDGTTIRRSRQELKEMDLYYNRPASELIFLKHPEHIRLHHKGKKNSEETRAKMSAWQIGDKNPMFGRTKDKNPNWKGGISSDHANYLRLWRKKRRAATSSFPQ